jgi:predicted nucleic acid-binding protein
VTFVDTSFWVALATASDGNHRAAAELWKGRPRQLTTSNHVVGETWTFMNRRHGHATATDLTFSLRASPSVSIVHCGPDLEDEAWRWLERHDEREYSFVNATSFAQMRRLGILTAFAFDSDFAAAGFSEALP